MTSYFECFVSPLKTITIRIAQDVNRTKATVFLGMFYVKIRLRRNCLSTKEDEDSLNSGDHKTCSRGIMLCIPLELIIFLLLKLNKKVKILGDTLFKQPS